MYVIYVFIYYIFVIFTFITKIGHLRNADTFFLYSADKYGRDQGFKALFTQSSTRHCGGDMFTNNGIIESPFFDETTRPPYPAYSNCVWVITGEAKNLYLTPLNFDTPYTIRTLPKNVVFVFCLFEELSFRWISNKSPL